MASCQNIGKNECYFEPIYLSSQDILVISDELAEIETYQITEYPKQKTEFEKIISSLQQTKSLFDPLIKSNWLVESMIKNKFYDPFQMRMEYKID